MALLSFVALAHNTHSYEQLSNFVLPTQKGEQEEIASYTPFGNRLPGSFYVPREGISIQRDGELLRKISETYMFHDDSEGTSPGSATFGMSNPSDSNLDVSRSFMLYHSMSRCI
jgi:hypothetical protein